VQRTIDELLARMRDDEASGFSERSRQLCEPAGRPRGRADRQAGGEAMARRRSWKRGLEQSDQCIASLQRQLPALRKFLARFDRRSLPATRATAATPDDLRATAWYGTAMRSALRCVSSSSHAVASRPHDESAPPRTLRATHRWPVLQRPGDAVEAGGESFARLGRARSRRARSQGGSPARTSTVLVWRLDGEDRDPRDKPIAMRSFIDIEDRNTDYLRDVLRS
jgi:hypothetical protein